MKSIVLGGGCFWCIEAVYQQVKGVSKVVSGYAGGDLANPTYSDHGTHAEVVQITYDENQLTLDTILEIFFNVHDPTTLNQPGTADDGPSYRSIILCSDSELDKAEAIKEKAQELWDKPIITEIAMLKEFYPAEDYHQDYYNQNQNSGYCQVIINPKLAKFRAKFELYSK
jgi:methionine-S-sulfoxide reductase